MIKHLFIKWEHTMPKTPKRHWYICSERKNLLFLTSSSVLVSATRATTTTVTAWMCAPRQDLFASQNGTNWLHARVYSYACVQFIHTAYTTCVLGKCGKQVNGNNNVVGFYSHFFLQFFPLYSLWKCIMSIWMVAVYYYQWLRLCVENYKFKKNLLFY